MKKIIVLFLSVLMLLSYSVTASADGILDSVFDKLASYTPQERANLIAYARPFVTTDAGVQAALANLDSGSMGGMITELFGDDMDKETIRRVFLSFTCIDDESELRIQYADIFQNKEEIRRASSETLSGVEILMEALYDYSPSTEKMFTEDDITAGVIANMLTIIPKINDDEFLIAYDDNNGFTVCSLYEEFQTSFDHIWKGHTLPDGKTVTYEKLIDQFVTLLNQHVSAADAEEVAQALSNLEVCDYTSDSGSGSGGGGGGGGGGSLIVPGDRGPKTYYTVLDHVDGVAAEEIGAGIAVQIAKDAPNVVTLETDINAPVMYEVVSGELVPVIYAMANDKGIRAQVKANGIYIIKPEVYPFADATGWGKTYISALYNRGIISGRSATTFEPDASITREEFVKLIVSLFGISEPNETVTFTDVQSGAWYYPYVAGAYKHNIVSGIGNELFGTGQKIKRQDMAKILCTVLEMNGVSLPAGSETAMKDMHIVSDYAKSYVLAAYDLGIISGDDQGNFNPNNFATRQEAAKMIYGMLDVYLDSLGA